MSGMRLTFAQVGRLWNLPSDECGRVLDYLVSAGRLTRDGDDRFCRDANALRARQLPDRERRTQ